jgi:hypothetical protein
MDVHPPHKAIESWRDFFIHLITITIGLMIALGLEGTVAWAHHRHLASEAREGIRREIEDNRSALAEDKKALFEDEQRMTKNITVLRQMRKTLVLPVKGELVSTISWSSPTESAWKTAHETGAVVYMGYKEVQSLDDIYLEQEIITNEVIRVFQEQPKVVSAFITHPDDEKLTSAEVELALQRAEETLVELKTLEQVVGQLDKMYSAQLSR